MTPEPLAPTRTPTALSAVTTLLAAALLAWAGAIARESALSDSEFAGIGYVVAVFLAAAAVLGLALAVPAFLLRRRPGSAARVLGWLGLAAVTAPVALLLWASR